MPRFPVPAGRGRDVVVHQGGRDRPAAPLPRGGARLRAQAGGLRGGRHRLEGLPRLLPRRRRLHQLGQAQRHPGRPGRGSGAGSMCAYAMGITDLDPIPHGLIFERFLNPERMSMPDFDVDFDERRRGEVIRYVTEKYGEERVAQIVTYGTIKAKQAVKDAEPGDGPPVRDGREAHQGDAAGRSWARTSRSPASSTRSTSATTRRRSSARSCTTRTGSSGGRRHGARASRA